MLLLKVPEEHLPVPDLEPVSQYSSYHEQKIYSDQSYSFSDFPGTQCRRPVKPPAVTCFPQHFQPYSVPDILQTRFPSVFEPVPVPVPVEKLENQILFVQEERPVPLPVRTVDAGFLYSIHSAMALLQSHEGKDQVDPFEEVL